MRIQIGLLRTILVIGLASFSMDLAAAQTYPTRAVTIIIPFPAGGNLEIIARPLADRLSSSLGHSLSSSRIVQAGRAAPWVPKR